MSFQQMIDVQEVLPRDILKVRIKNYFNTTNEWCHDVDLSEIYDPINYLRKSRKLKAYSFKFFKRIP